MSERLGADFAEAVDRGVDCAIGMTRHDRLLRAVVVQLTAALAVGAVLTPAQSSRLATALQLMRTLSLLPEKPEIVHQGGSSNSGLSGGDRAFVHNGCGRERMDRIMSHRAKSIASFATEWGEQRTPLGVVRNLVEVELCTLAPKPSSSEASLLAA